MEHQVEQVHKDLQELQEVMELMEHQVEQVHRDLQELQEVMELMEHQAEQVHREVKDQQVQVEHLHRLQGLKVFKELLEPLELHLL
jgi:predicted  nucleic acid-binding Zn-ribbon protein